MDENEKLIVLLNIVSIICGIKLKNKKKTRAKRRMWSREWLLRRGCGRDITQLVMKELQFEDSSSFQNYTRMKKETFFKLLNIIKPIIEKEDTILREAIPASTR